MYTKHVWLPRLGTKLNRYLKTNDTTESVELTNSPDTITQAGTPFSPDIMNEMEGGISMGAANASYFATETTASGTTEAKTAGGSNDIDYDDNPIIEVMMSYAQLYDNRTLVSGSTVTYQNTILKANALTLSYNGGTAYPIKGGRGEYLGIGAWGAGELLRFRFVGSLAAGGYWYCENAQAIMQGGDETNGYYTKYTNGQITQPTQPDWKNAVNISSHTTKTNYYTAPTDGYVVTCGTDSYTANVWLYVSNDNGTNWTYLTIFYTDVNSNTKGSFGIVPMKKGDLVYGAPFEKSTMFSFVPQYTLIKP
jgi:hypothetical protein